MLADILFSWNQRILTADQLKPELGNDESSIWVWEETHWIIEATSSKRVRIAKSIQWKHSKIDRQAPQCQ